MLSRKFYKRKGIFSIARSCLTDSAMANELLEALSGILIVKAIYLPKLDCVTYFGFSELFDVVEDGEDTNVYVFKKEKVDGKIKTGWKNVSAKKLEDGFKFKECKGCACFKCPSRLCPVIHDGTFCSVCHESEDSTDMFLCAFVSVLNEDFKEYYD